MCGGPTHSLTQPPALDQKHESWYASSTVKLRHTNIISPHDCSQVTPLPKCLLGGVHLLISLCLFPDSVRLLTLLPQPYTHSAPQYTTSTAAAPFSSLFARSSRGYCHTPSLDLSHPCLLCPPCRCRRPRLLRLPVIPSIQLLQRPHHTLEPAGKRRGSSGMMPPLGEDGGKRGPFHSRLLHTAPPANPSHPEGRMMPPFLRHSRATEDPPSPHPANPPLCFLQPRSVRIPHPGFHLTGLFGATPAPSAHSSHSPGHGGTSGRWQQRREQWGGKVRGEGIGEAWG